MIQAATAHFEGMTARLHIAEDGVWYRLPDGTAVRANLVLNAATLVARVDGGCGDDLVLAQSFAAGVQLGVLMVTHDRDRASAVRLEWPPVDEDPSTE